MSRLPDYWVDRAFAYARATQDDEIAMLVAWKRRCRELVICLSAGHDPEHALSWRGFVGFDHNGRFVHYCHCGAWGSHGFVVSTRSGQFGVWYCTEHVVRDQPAVPAERQPAVAHRP